MDAATATLNIRLPESLKQRGMQVLAREGVSVSDVVRDLFCEMEETQELPAYSQRQRSAVDQEQRDYKRALMCTMVGILPEGTTVEVVRQARLEEACRAGVRA